MWQAVFGRGIRALSRQLREDERVGIQAESGGRRAVLVSQAQSRAVEV